MGEDLLGLDWDLAGADGGCGEPVGEALDDVAVRDGVVEVAQPLLHLRHLRVREPERRPPVLGGRSILRFAEAAAADEAVALEDPTDRSSSEKEDSGY